MCKFILCYESLPRFSHIDINIFWNICTLAYQNENYDNNPYHIMIDKLLDNIKNGIKYENQIYRI
jgi:hypothetical protein